MATQGAFTQRTVTILVAVGVLSFAGAAYFTIFGEDLRTKRTVGANSYSYSAIGHRAFVETLRRLEIPVLISRNNTAAKAGANSVLVVAEPIAQGRNDKRMAEWLNTPITLIVLPKRYGFKDTLNRQWLGSANLLPKGTVEHTLRNVVWDSGIVRPDGPVAWRSNRFEASPDIETPQLMTARLLKPIVGSDQGMLLGELRRGYRRIWVLSDPDVLSNHGIESGDNAVLAVGVINALKPRDGVVIVDETIHGFRLDPSLWRTFFEFPYVIATIQAVAALIVLLWAATGRFGAPASVKRPFEAGKAALINNTARLLERGGHAKDIFRRYLEVTLKDVAHRVHAPRHLDGEALIDWLDRVGKAHGVTTTYRSVRQRAERLTAASGADGTRTARAARNLHRWKQEMLHGPAGHSDGQHPTQRTDQKDRRRPGDRA